MGNCCIRESAVFDGEDWGSLKKPATDSGGAASNLGEKQRLLGTCASSSSSSSSSGSCKREVKIKITKRELEEIMEKVQKQGLSMEEVMANLIVNSSSNSDSQELRHFHRSWKPALQSIPELN